MDRKQRRAGRESGRQWLSLYLSIIPGPNASPPPASSLPAPADSNLVDALLRRSQLANRGAEPGQAPRNVPCTLV